MSKGNCWFVDNVGGKINYEVLADSGLNCVLMNHQVVYNVAGKNYEELLADSGLNYCVLMSKGNCWVVNNVGGKLRTAFGPFWI